MTVHYVTPFFVAPIAIGVIAMGATAGEMTAQTVAVGALIGIVFTGVVNVIVAWRSTAAVKEVKAAVELVAGHVNSAATAQTMKIDALTKEVTDARAQMANMEKIAALLAQEKVAQVASVAAIPKT